MIQKRSVIAAPLLSPSHLNPFNGSSGLPGVLADSGPVRFYFSGSHAIWNGLQALKFDRDAEVLFPSYHCGAELDAVLKAGVRVQFYRVDPNLKIDLDSVKKRVGAATRALFVIHYFGFPQPMDEIEAFCRERSLLMIEDCAHALYSAYQNRPLGTFGEMAIFSLRKYLPLPEGGSLRMNGGISLPEEGPSPPRDETLRTLKREIERTLGIRWGMPGRLVLSFERALLRLWKRWSRLTAGPGLPKSLDPSIDFSIANGHWGMSPLSHRILSRIDHAAVIRKRSENFKRLAEALRSCRTVKVLFKELPEGVCPWMFPIRAEKVGSLIAHLQAGGIEVEPFWKERHRAFPVQTFPEVSQLRDQLLALPIHQDLDERAMVHLSERIDSWKP